MLRRASTNQYIFCRHNEWETQTHKPPRVNMPKTLIFCDFLICNFLIYGIGRTRTQRSRKKLTVFVPMKNSLSFTWQVAFLMVLSQYAATGMQCNVMAIY